jgi:hypothetical protein
MTKIPTTTKTNINDYTNEAVCTNWITKCGEMEKALRRSCHYPQGRGGVKDTSKNKAM